MKLSNNSKLLVSIAIPQLVGIFGSAFTISAIPTWYAALNKPEINPPNWLFGPVWTALYLLMGIAAFLVWKKGFENREVKIALTIFGLQLILNFFWTIIFFGLKNPLAAFIEIIVLWIAIMFNIVYFYKVSKIAAYLLVPYLLWVSFASYLNFSIWILNR